MTGIQVRISLCESAYTTLCAHNAVSESITAKQVVSVADRQARVVLRQLGSRRIGCRQSAQLGQLQLRVELVAVAVQRGRHPPGEVGGSPDPPDRKSVV